VSSPDPHHVHDALTVGSSVAVLVDSGTWHGHLDLRADRDAIIQWTTLHFESGAITPRRTDHVESRRSISRSAPSDRSALATTTHDRSEFARRISAVRRWNRQLGADLTESLPFGATVILLGGDFVFLPTRLREHRPDLHLVMIDPLDDLASDAIIRFGCTSDLAIEFESCDLVHRSTAIPPRSESVDGEHPTNERFRHAVG